MKISKIIGKVLLFISIVLITVCFSMEMAYLNITDDESKIVAIIYTIMFLTLIIGFILMHSEYYIIKRLGSVFVSLAMPLWFINAIISLKENNGYYLDNDKELLIIPIFIIIAVVFCLAYYILELITTFISKEKELTTVEEKKTS